MPCYVLEKPALAINSQFQPPRALRPERRGRAASLLIDGIEQLASVNMNNGFPGEMSDMPTAPRHRHRHRHRVLQGIKRTQQCIASLARRPTQVPQYVRRIRGPARSPPAQTKSNQLVIHPEPRREVT